jgi:predicted AlkP superfamily pyrophosphatase or phosphodiesterase
MKKSTLLFALLISFCFSYGQKVEHVIVLGIDGCDIDGLTAARTPNIDSLVAHGSWTYEAKAQMPTVSSPNWSSIIDGVPPKVNGVFGNDWEHKNVKDSVFCGGKKGHIFPTIFRVLRESDKHAQICCINEWWSFRRLVENGVCSIRQRTVWEGITDFRVPTVINVRRPKFLFIHFNDVDETGHKYGHGSQVKEYVTAIERVDKSIGKIIKAVKHAHMLESTVFVIIADHGGIGHGHGGSTPQEVNVPFIISGAGIKKGHHISAYVNNYNLSPTIAKMLNAKVPACWQGKVVEEIFE